MNTQNKNASASIDKTNHISMWRGRPIADYNRNELIGIVEWCIGQTTLLQAERDRLAKNQKISDLDWREIQAQVVRYERRRQRRQRLHWLLFAGLGVLLMVALFK